MVQSFIIKTRFQCMNLCTLKGTVEREAAMGTGASLSHPCSSTGPVCLSASSPAPTAIAPML